MHTRTHTSAAQDDQIFSLSDLSAVLPLRGSMVPPAGQPAHKSAPPWGAYRLDEQLTVGENTVCSSWRHLFSTLCSPMEGVAVVISAARLKWTFPSLLLVITGRSLRHTNGKIHPHKGANRNNAKQLLYNLQLVERFKVKYLFCYNSVHRFCASLKIISTVFPVAKFLAGLLENEEI